MIIAQYCINCYEISIYLTNIAFYVCNITLQCAQTALPGSKHNGVFHH